MAHVQHNAKLNQLQIDIGRSLLQYVGHCSTWSSRSEAALQEEFTSLVATQQEHVAQLSDLLTERRWPIDFGGFPASFTDLHFLSLKYLLKLILVNQKAVLVELEEATHTCVDDPEAVQLIEQVLASERQLTERLQSLSTVGAAA
ncbi:hypothetical protein [Schlesneria paludicola]|uniref:hypothetical protein n=1 Tax=Schlesneria paludicola TaxID=360056 RepID=UPI000299EF0E|nr:hypothetical protein [Schlesneria paludicola]